MEPAETVSSILRAAPGEGFCDACLAFALELPLLTLQSIRKQLVVARGEYVAAAGPCSSCGRIARTTAAIPVVGGVAGTPPVHPPPKCVRCSRRVTKDEEEIVNGDLFHRQCWLILKSDAQIADSRQMARLVSC
jgi:hypothetical protein